MVEFPDVLFGRILGGFGVVLGFSFLLGFFLLEEGLWFALG